VTRRDDQPTDDRETVTTATRRARRRLVIVAAAVALVAPALLAAARWPSWWTWIAPEQTPMTWLQSVTLVLAATGAVLIAHVVALGGTPRNAGALRLLAAGLAALAVDERFALHERLRDGVLAPRDVTVPFLPWVGPGDFLLLAVGLVGLAVLPLVWRAIGPDVGARRALLVGVALAAVAVGMDSIDPSLWTVSAERVQQTTEEIIELAGALALLCAVGLRLLGLLDTVAAGTSPSHRTRSAAATTPPRHVRTDEIAH